jgi:hypothetical protein
LTIAGRTFFINQAGRACSFSLDPASLAIGPDAMTDTVSVTASEGCSWTASTTATWITITSGTSGTGNGAVTFSIAQNTGSASRTGTIAIAGRLFSISQAGACAYTLSPAATSVGAAGTTLDLLLSTGAACAWTATSEAPWISITTAASGTGSASIRLSIAANSAASRTGTVTAGGQTFTATQSGCSYTVSPTTVSATAAARTSSVLVSTTASCGWTAQSDVSWITLPGGTTGTGTSWLGYAIAANPNTTPRSGTLTVADRPVTVNQAAASCTYSVSPTAVVISNAGGSATVSVTTSDNCTWTVPAASVPWITLVPTGSQTGPGTVIVQAAPNPGSLPRSTLISVAGRFVTVTQQQIAPLTTPSGLRIIRE